MGGIKNKYLRFAAAGDQYAGRCASLLNQNDKTFAVSPPYFDYTSIKCERERDEKHQEKGKRMCDRIPNYNHMESHTLHLA